MQNNIKDDKREGYASSNLKVPKPEKTAKNPDLVLQL
jgi:hypothetical protein